MNINETEFTQVNLEDFLGKEQKQTEDSGIIAFTEYQLELIDRLKAALEENAPDRLTYLNNRLNDVNALVKAMKKFPSLLETTFTNSSKRTTEELINNLIKSYQWDGDKLLHNPSKATLGKGFLVAKIHTFYSMSKLARNFAHMEPKEVQEYTNETTSMMFTLMAEDVYLNLIKDKYTKMDMKRELAMSLLILWEHRSDQTMNDIAPVLQSVWKARTTLAPAFGTMMGTSELLTLSFQLDENWGQFIKTQLSNEDVTMAMEEFLFGLSYEQISKLKEILRKGGIKSIGRDEIKDYLGEQVKVDLTFDYRDFYLVYTQRRDNARARQKFNIPGPKNTLEDHFISFIMERNYEKQHNDSFAK